MSAARNTILVCDDERDIRELVADYLGARGFDALACKDADELMRRLERAPANLVVLDINMPGQDGLSALRDIRQRFEIPVIMLTGASETIDRVIGLELGADDYISKPFDLREVEARIKTVLRRGAAQGAPASDKRTVQFGETTLDLEAARLFDRDGKEIAITAMEFALLKVFASNRGRVLNRDQLLEAAHDREWDPSDRSIDLRISRLRRKVERNPSKPEVLRTVRGVGYIFG